MLSTAFREISPVKPATAYIGGKSRIANQIVEIISKISHTTYVEPFVGMGGVFLRRRHQPAAEVVNDISKDVAIFFRILQRHYPQFMETLKFQITSRVAFERLSQSDPDTLTDLERSARFLYLQSLSFGGKVAGRTFGVSTGRSARFNVQTLGPRLEEIHERLSGVVIECLPYGELIDRYDRPDTLFYCDPPYFGSEGYYGKDAFSRNDFDKLADHLRKVKGSFILSINDHAEIRRIFAEFPMKEMPNAYSVCGGKPKATQELLIFGGLSLPAICHI